MWIASIGANTLVIRQLESTHEYTASIGTEGKVLWSDEGFKSKRKAIKAATVWLKSFQLGREKHEGKLFDVDTGVCATCQSEECECGSEETEDEEVGVKITTVKTTRKEKLEENEPGKNDLKLALWYIEKIGGTKRAKQVLTAACKAMDEIKKKGT